MFVNQWRKRVYILWIITIPISLLAGFAKNAGLLLPYSHYLFIAGIVLAVAGLVILKTLGRPGRSVID